MTDSTPSPASASSAEHDLSGRQLGDYRVLRRIGRGAMAEVYLAEQSSLSRQVALKVLRRQLAEDASYVQRFQNEARAAAALVHANIVQIYEVGRIDDVHFIALEYVQGAQLRQLLGRHGPVDAPLAATIMRQVAAALHKAAQRGIVHRDIKPENIMISPAGEVKVADFGLSRIAGDAELNLTQVGVTMGTPLYMSPEQAEGRPLDERSDLYSFGVTCYHMLAGRPPFEGETALAVAVQHVRNQPPRLEGMRPDLPEGLCRIVHRLLEKKPDDRYGDAAQLLRDLRGLQVGAAGEQDGDDAEHWATAELIAMTDARLAATQRLEAIMKSAAHVAAPRASAWRWAIAAGVAAFLLGGVWAWLGREPYLLARRPNEAPPQVERLATPEAQYWHAVALQTEEGYQAVWRYFPADAYYVGLAKQQLARWYVSHDDMQRALRVFAELADAAGTEERLRAFGLAGQVLAYERLGDREKMAEKMTQALPLKEHLDAQMRRELDRIARDGG